jgi:glycosyltransferase involved in cell wall biosynthesis
MIFIASVLAMNGGTTFLIRTCRELAARGTRSTVLLLRPEYDAQLRTELERHAEVLCLDDFLIDRGRLFRAQLGVFGVVDWPALESTLSAADGQIHVMGVFGLIFALRLTGRRAGGRITVGVYHQNEFLFRPPPFFFAREALRLFAAMPAENLVFFNEATRRNYERFFRTDYAASTIVPIGIDLSQGVPSAEAQEPWRIVSVGNLVNFKTYNAHMIRITAQLASAYPGIRYDIYGTGPEEATLRALAAELRVGKHGRFMGAVPYADFRKVVAGAAVFVGSGTALIEAADAGVPALVGIESIETPDTYGFLSDVEGLSYNENIPEIPKQPMRALIERLFVSPADRASVSQACRVKAREFSVATTVDGFLALERSAKSVARRLGWACLVRMMASLVGMAVCERLGWVTSFRNRRDQSF